MATIRWEDALKFFASEAQRTAKIATREQVTTTTGDQRWFTPVKKFEWGRASATTGRPRESSPVGRSPTCGGRGTTRTRGNYHAVITLSFNDKDFGDHPDNVLHKFRDQRQDILSPLWLGDKHNDTINSDSLRAAATAIGKVRSWLATWEPRVKGWAAKIDAPDSNWQGSAAGEFKTLLERYALEMATIRLQLDGEPYETDLNAAAAAIDFAAAGMDLLGSNWALDPLSWPAQASLQALTETLQDVKPEFTTIPSDGAVATAFGDPRHDVFYIQLEQRAKTIWLDNVVKYLDNRHFGTVVDVAAGGGSDPMDALEAAYTQLNADFGFGYRSASLTLPPCRYRTPRRTGPTPARTGPTPRRTVATARST